MQLEQLTAFTFEITSLFDLQSKLNEEVGYPVGPANICCLSIKPELSKYRIDVTIWYHERALERLKQLQL
jgi:hypothetical protein